MKGLDSRHLTSAATSVLSLPIYSIISPQLIPFPSGANGHWPRWAVADALRGPGQPLRHRPPYPIRRDHSLITLSRYVELDVNDRVWPSFLLSRQVYPPRFDCHRRLRMVRTDTPATNSLPPTPASSESSAIFFSPSSFPQQLGMSHNRP